MNNKSRYQNTYSNPPWAMSSQCQVKPISSIWDSDSRAKDGTVIKANLDLLAVAANLFRRYPDDPANRFQNLATIQVDLSPEDIQASDNIAEYFGQKIVWAKLSSDRSLTKFEQGVTEFLSSGRREIDANSIGLIHRMPEYYCSDRQILDMIDNYFNYDYQITVGPYVPEVFDLDLQFIMSTDRKTKYQDTKQYWFKDIESGAPVVLSIHSPNQSLTPIWDYLVRSVDKITVNGKFKRFNHQLRFDCISAVDWNLRTETLKLA